MSYEMLGIHEDPNGALINNIEEYGPSTYSFDNSFKENVVFYGVSKSMCWFEYLHMKHLVIFQDGIVCVATLKEFEFWSESLLHLMF